MKVRSSVEYVIDAYPIIDQAGVLIVVDKVTAEQLPPFFKQVPLEELDHGGFDGIETGVVIDVLDFDVCAGKTPEQILDDYFNSPYGIA